MRTFITEQELALRCARKDQVAQGELYERYAAGLFALCLRYTPKIEEAQDLMHDAMIKAMDNFNSFKFTGAGSVWAWLCRITINLLIDRFKKNNRFKLVPIDQINDEDIEYEMEPDAELVEGIPDSVLEHIITGLSPLKRVIFNMYYIDGFSHKDIAKALDISERGSTSILAKARTSVKTAIIKYLNNTKL